MGEGDWSQFFIHCHWGFTFGRGQMSPDFQMVGVYASRIFEFHMAHTAGSRLSAHDFSNQLGMESGLMAFQVLIRLSKLTTSDTGIMYLSGIGN